jgi:hypothetical protein
MTAAWVDETAMTDLSVDQPARVVFRSDPARSYVGEVARLGREADRETREFFDRTYEMEDGRLKSETNSPPH